MTSKQNALTDKFLTHVRGANYPELGLLLRTDRKGPESELVRCFLDDAPWDVPLGSHLTVFEQPKLDTGFPDVVFVLWDTGTTITWSDQRLAVTQAEIRLVHHLVTTGATKLDELQAMFGRWVIDSIERLLAAQMIYCENGRWRARRLETIFAVQQIIAFEAKIDAPSQALEQASRNRWFASHSYILVPNKPRDSRSIRKANQFGVGVWSFHCDSWFCHVPSAVEAIPRSYASWLFNEWVWRLAKLTSGTLSGEQP